MSDELIKVVMRRLNYYHDNPITPQYPFSMRDLELRARTIIKDVDEQRAKEAAERKEEAREYDTHVAKIVAEERREDAIEAWGEFWNGPR